MVLDSETKKSEDGWSGEDSKWRMQCNTGHSFKRSEKYYSIVYRHTCYNLQLKEKCKHLSGVVSATNML